MEEESNLVLKEIKRLEIDCPDCKYHLDDDQYTCAICWCEGGGGKINVYSWVKDNINLFK